jgi:hypothetical protein
MFPVLIFIPGNGGTFQLVNLPEDFPDKLFRIISYNSSEKDLDLIKIGYAMGKLWNS